MSFEPKRRKFNPPPRRTVSPYKRQESFAEARDSPNLMQAASSHHVSMAMARDHAVAQAKHDGCTANFRIFDSPFGNFLIPSIPTRTELSGFQSSL